MKIVYAKRPDTNVVCPGCGHEYFIDWGQITEDGHEIGECSGVKFMIKPEDYEENDI